MADNYWFDIDAEIVAGDADSWTLVFSSGGSAVDISLWSFYYKASASWTTDTISIPNGSMSLSDSGTGTTDTLTVPFDETDTDIDVGKYQHSLVAVIGSDTRTIFRGSVSIKDKRAVVV